MRAVFDAAESAHGPLRGVVHCAGRGGDRTRIVSRDGEPGPLDTFAEVIRVNLIGTYNVLRLAAARMARTEPIDGERGAIVLTASVAAFDGQIGQTSYTAAKAAVHGITLVAARDLASRLIRVNTIAPGVFDTPMLGRLREDIRAGLESAVPHPSRLGAARRLRPSGRVDPAERVPQRRDDPPRRRDPDAAALIRALITPVNTSSSERARHLACASVLSCPIREPIQDSGPSCA